MNVELKDLELEAFVPINVKVLEVKPKIEVASTAIVTQKRSDGGTVLTIPQCHIWIDTEGKPVRAWAESKDVHISGLMRMPYEIELPLMPATKEEVKEGDEGNPP